MGAYERVNEALHPQPTWSASKTKRAQMLGTLLACDVPDDREPGHVEACVQSCGGALFSLHDCLYEPSLALKDHNFRAHLLREHGIFLDSHSGTLHKLLPYEGDESTDAFAHLNKANGDAVVRLKRGESGAERLLFREGEVQRVPGRRDAVFFYTSQGWRMFFCEDISQFFSMLEFYEYFISVSALWKEYEFSYSKREHLIEEIIQREGHAFH